MRSKELFFHRTHQVSKLKEEKSVFLVNSEEDAHSLLQIGRIPEQNQQNGKY